MDKSLMDGLTQKFDRQEACDVVFLVEEKQIGVHRIALAAQCQVLYDMSKDWTPTDKPIPVEDIDCKSFEAFLRFLYCGEVALSSENVFLLLSASVQFKIEYLEKMCVEHIVESVGENSVACYMQEAVKFGSKLLQKICLVIFEKQTGKVIESPSFLKLSQNALSAFLDAAEINISEITLYNNVKKWMELKCEERSLAISGENMREIIGDAIFKIRFPTMGAQDFANDVSTIEGFLSATEKSQIFQMIMVSEQRNIECSFSNESRCQSPSNVPMQDIRQSLKTTVLCRNESGMQKSLVDALTGLFDKQQACDVVFFVKGKGIGAHRIVLATQCPVLYDLSKDWTPTEKPITLDVTDYKSFEALLRFLYCGEINLSNENVSNFLSLSVGFQMDSLEKMCMDHIAKSMNIDNVSSYMDEAVKFGSKLSEKMCLEIFEKHTAHVIKSLSFKELSQPALSAFLDAEEINVLEITLFHRISLWMQQKCKERGLATTGENMREVIGDAIFKIRFPTMTGQDFANSVTTIKGFLSDTEKSQIFQMIMVFDNKTIECPFSNQFRCQKSHYYVPMRDMRQLLKEKVLYRCQEEQSFNVRALVDHLENLEDDTDMLDGSFNLVVQCCADMANSCFPRNNTNLENLGSRQELSKKLERWESACTSEKKNVSKIMTSFMDLRKELDNLTKWS